MTYFASNASLSFNISAASVEPNLNVTANLLLNVYGMQPVNITLDLCSILNGALCPLPTYNFTGSDSIPLPRSVDVAGRVPSVAYWIPDLEAVAQLTLTEVGTGDVKACVQSTLSNGWSTYQPAVSWSTGALTLLALLSALWQSINSSLAPTRLLNLISLLQSIAISALLDVNYPLLYRSFASNFAWSLGLFPSTGASRIQNAVDELRHHTGGTMPDAEGGSAVDLVNRRLSPYNILAAVAKAASKEGEVGVATVTQGSSNVLQAGIPVFVNSIGIATANAFMSAFIVALILAAVFLGMVGIGWAAVTLWRRAGKAEVEGGQEKDTGAKVDEWMANYPQWAKSWALRLVRLPSTSPSPPH